MLTQYLNQKVELKTVSSYDEYGQITYNTAVEIKVRFEQKDIETIDRYGQKIYGSARVFTKENLNIDDVITYNSRDYTIIQIQNMVGLNQNIGYECVLK